MNVEYAPRAIADLRNIGAQSRRVFGDAVASTWTRNSLIRELRVVVGTSDCGNLGDSLSPLAVRFTHLRGSI
jgi:hypothetical protein